MKLQTTIKHTLFAAVLAAGLGACHHEHTNTPANPPPQQTEYNGTQNFQPGYGTERQGQQVAPQQGQQAYPQGQQQQGQQQQGQQAYPQGQQVAPQQGQQGQQGQQAYPQEGQQGQQVNPQGEQNYPQGQQQQKQQTNPSSTTPNSDQNKLPENGEGSGSGSGSDNGIPDSGTP